MRVWALALVAACGERAPDAVAVDPVRDAAPRPSADASTPEPVQMLPPSKDPWGPDAPRRPAQPPSNKRLPVKPARDAPEPADADFALFWEDRPRVRVHMPVGNWRVNRPILVGGASPPLGIMFNPSWYEANIDLELRVTCHGVCEEKELPANIVSSARDKFDFERSTNHWPPLVPRWIEKPHLVSGLWTWRFDASDKVGNVFEGHVGVSRILPELDAILECRGATNRRANPVWLDRLDTLCRELTFEILP